MSKVAAGLGMVAGVGGLSYALYKAGELEKRIKAIEALLAEYGIGPPVGWVDKVERKLDELQGAASRLEGAVSGLEGRVAGLEATATDLARSLGELEGRVRRLEEAMSSVERWASVVHELLKVMAGEFTDLAGKVHAIAEELRTPEWPPEKARSIANKLDSIASELEELERTIKGSLR